MYGLHLKKQAFPFHIISFHILFFSQCFRTEIFHDMHINREAINIRKLMAEKEYLRQCVLCTL